MGINIQYLYTWFILCEHLYSRIGEDKKKFRSPLCASLKIKFMHELIFYLLVLWVVVRGYLIINNINFFSSFPFFYRNSVFLNLFSSTVATICILFITVALGDFHLRDSILVTIKTRSTCA